MDSDSFGLLLALSADLITALVGCMEDAVDAHQQPCINAQH